MPRGIRYRPPKTVQARAAPHFEDRGNTRPSNPIPWGGETGVLSSRPRAITQEEADRVRNTVPLRNLQYRESSEGIIDARENDAARLRNQREYGERPPENRPRRRVNIQR